MSPLDKQDKWLSVDSMRFFRWLVIVCVASELFFVFMDATVNAANWSSSGEIRRLFNITREDSLSSWFASTQTWMSALTIWTIAVLSRRDGRPRGVVIGWMVVAVFFTYMAIDDGSRLHERLGSAIAEASERNTEGRQTLIDSMFGFFPSYSWQVVFMPFFAAMGIFCAVFLWREIPVMKARILVGVALVLLATAVGLDFVEGLHEEHPLNLYTIIIERMGLHEDILWMTFNKDIYGVFVHFSKSLEEFLEMFANTILWVVFLWVIMRDGGYLSIRFTNVPGAQPPAE